MIAFWIDVILLVVFVLILIFLIEIFFGLFICFLLDFISLRFIWDKNYSSKRNSSSMSTLNFKTPRKITIIISFAIFSTILLAFYFWNFILAFTVAFLVYKVTTNKYLARNERKILHKQAKKETDTSALNFDEFTTCQICYEDFDLEKRIPLLLTCKFIFSLLVSKSNVNLFYF